MSKPFAWLMRLVGGVPVAKPARRDGAAPAAAPAASGQPGAGPSARAVPAASAATAAAPVAAPAPAPTPAFGARRPLVASNGEVAGFEFRLPASLERRLNERSDGKVQGAHVIALLSAMRPTLEAGRIALASLPATVVLRDAVTDQVPVGAMLQLSGLDAHAAEQRAAIEALRRRGVRVGVPAVLDANGQPPELVDELDFAVLTSGALDPDPATETDDDGAPRTFTGYPSGRPPATDDAQALEALIVRATIYQGARPGLQLVAIDLADIEALERALKAGVQLAAGRVDAHGPGRELRPLQAGAVRLCQMLNDVVMDRDTAKIAADIRADVGLSYRMLRYVNSPALGLGRTVESIEQAVMLLGRNELYRWLSVLLLAAGDGRRTSRALQEIALSRARLLELLAQQRGDAPDKLFTVGLMSLLDAMLQVPLAQAIEPLNLGDAAREALLQKAGPWRPYVELASALERQDLAAAEPLAEAYGGIDVVLPLSDEAWQWASQVGATMKAAG